VVEMVETWWKDDGKVVGKWWKDGRNGEEWWKGGGKVMKR
jgi:hypothetical protein